MTSNTTVSSRVDGPLSTGRFQHPTRRLGWLIGQGSCMPQATILGTAQAPSSSSHTHMYSTANEAMPLSASKVTAQAQPRPEAEPSPSGMTSSQLFIQPPCVTVATPLPPRCTTQASHSSLQSQLARLQQLRSSAQKMVSGSAMVTPTQQDLQPAGTHHLTPQLDRLTGPASTSPAAWCAPSTPTQQAVERKDEQTPCTAALRALAVQPATPPPSQRAAFGSHARQEAATLQYRSLAQQLEQMRQLQAAGRALVGDT